uniref:Uncharacterized protein n=1 Tax=Cacopsylla melanoneura TaxID=428564 RepID=A0A8D8PZE8_9HEMI
MSSTPAPQSVALTNGSHPPSYCLWTGVRVGSHFKSKTPPPGLSSSPISASLHSTALTRGSGFSPAAVNGLIIQLVTGSITISPASKRTRVSSPVQGTRVCIPRMRSAPI